MVRTPERWIGAPEAVDTEVPFVDGVADNPWLFAVAGLDCDDRFEDEDFELSGLASLSS